MIDDRKDIKIIIETARYQEEIIMTKEFVWDAIPKSIGEVMIKKIKKVWNKEYK